MVISNSVDGDRVSASGNINCHTIRDMWSGFVWVIPSKSRNQAKIYHNLKFFAGLIWDTSPEIIVKSDAASEIIAAVNDLGWHSIPSLANVWPHNTDHERSHLTVKSIARALMTQAGFPEDCWDFSAPNASISHNVTKLAPILPWEKDAAGNVLEAYKEKSQRTCWHAHTGEPFTGVMQPFGRLCYYLRRDGHPVGPTTTPGFFLGWRMELG